jgi:hypothetical protein
MYTDIPENPSVNAVSDKEICWFTTFSDINDEALPISKNETISKDIHCGKFICSIQPTMIEKKVTYADTYMQDLADDFIDEDNEKTLLSKLPLKSEAEQSAFQIIPDIIVDAMVTTYNITPSEIDPLIPHPTPEITNASDGLEHNGNSLSYSS